MFTCLTIIDFRGLSMRMSVAVREPKRGPCVAFLCSAFDSINSDDTRLEDLHKALMLRIRAM